MEIEMDMIDLPWTYSLYRARAALRRLSPTADCVSMSRIFPSGPLLLSVIDRSM